MSMSAHPPTAPHQQCRDHHLRSRLEWRDGHRHHEGSLRKLFGQFLAHGASVLVIVDQPNNIGRLTVAVAPDMGADVRYLPGPSGYLNVSPGDEDTNDFITAMRKAKKPGRWSTPTSG